MLTGTQATDLPNGHHCESMFPSNPVHAIIFDLGHTLWDYAPRPDAFRLRVLQLHHRLQGASIDAASPKELERALTESFSSWYSASVRNGYVQPPSHELVRRALDPLDSTLSDELLTDVTHLLLATELELPVIEPDTLAALGSLAQQGISMGCVTNTLLLQEGIEDIVDRLGLRRYLKCVVVSSQVGRHKPHEALFQLALDGLGIGPTEAVFVGDRLVEDVAGAKAVGMRGVLTTQYRTDRGYVAVVPDAVISRLSELPGLLTGWSDI